jgi:hypothetical protein
MRSDKLFLVDFTFCHLFLNSAEGLSAQRGRRFADKLFPSKQGDQIGRIFGRRALLYFNHPF